MGTSPIDIWVMAVRPKTLPAAMAPVIMGTGMAYGDGVHHWPSALVALLGSLTIQIGTNLVNDYYDFKKGADRADRLGPTRVMQAGLIKPISMLVAIIFVFTLAAIACWWLVQRGGKPIALIGIFSILSGIFYTAGPRPIGYIGLGELFVLIFFGPVAVAGTYYVQSLEMNPAVILAGFGPGFLAAGILIINNLRDIATDTRSGKKTLAVRFGPSFAKAEYLFAIICACLIPLLVYSLMQDHLGLLFVTVTLFFAIPAIHTVYTKSDGPSLNNALAYTGKLLLMYSLIFSAGWIF